MAPAVKTPETPEQLRELLGMADDTKKFGKAVEEHGGIRQFMDAYARAFMKHDPEAKQQMTEAEQRGMLAMLRDGAKPDPKYYAGPVLGAEKLRGGPMAGGQRWRKDYARYNPHAEGARLDEEKYAQDLGSHFRAIWASSRTQMTPDSDDVRRYIQKMDQVLRNAMSEKVPADGGFLVPEVLRSELLRISLETAIVRSRARVVPMESLRVPYPTIDDTSHVTNVYGGVQGYWTEEAAALTNSQPAFGRTVLEAKKLTLYTEIPNELFSDSAVTLTQFLNEIFPEALAYFEDDAFINGSGQGEPQGYITSPAAIAVTRKTTSHVYFPDIANMYAQMWPASLSRAVWICSPAVIAELLQLALVNPGGGTGVASPPSFITNMQVLDAPTMTIFGRPLIVSEKVPNLGTAGDLSFVDFGYYLLGDRQAMQASTSEQYKFQNDVTAFRVIERVDGRTWIQSPITPRNSGSQLSPVVLLHA